MPDFSKAVTKRARIFSRAPWKVGTMTAVPVVGVAGASHGVEINRFFCESYRAKRQGGDQAGHHAQVKCPSHVAVCIVVLG